MKFTPLLGAQLSGSLAGITASRNRGGAYFRERAIPVQPNTSFQAVIKAIFGGLSTRWSATLTTIQRAAWDQYADGTPLIDVNGDEFIPTGLNMYIRGNTALSQNEQMIVDNGPTTLGLPTVAPLGVSSMSTATEIASVTFDNTDPWANEDEGFLFVYMSRPQKPSINFFKGPYQLAGSVQGDNMTPPTSPASITSPFATVAGDKVFFRAFAIDGEGRKSSDQFFEIITT